MGAGNVRNAGFDHMTIVVTDLDEARRFFGLLGFEERLAVVAQGQEIARYMGIDDWEADHVTLALDGAVTHQEVQLLRFHRPDAAPDEGAGTLARIGFNHVCFRVEDLDAMVAHLAGHGVTPRNEVMDFHDRRLVFLDGPGVVVELAEWVRGPGAEGVT
ncbi:MAG TPA: VOC family protein [Acidimicrobiales bacterium]|nr:VOC family protein [Acidimicrobiales bacterium]